MCDLAEGIILREESCQKGMLERVGDLVEEGVVEGTWLWRLREKKIPD